MQQYLLSVHSVEGTPLPPDDVIQQSLRDTAALNTELQDAGVWVFAGGLHPPTTATVVQVRDDEILITDGPFAETKEHVGGFWVIQVPDLDTALTWAAKATRACANPVEVRPFQEETEG